MSFPAFKPLRILIAEDVEDTRITLAKLLELKGHEIKGQASDGSELLALTKTIGSEQIDVYIVDVNMSHQHDGITAGKEAYHRWRIPSILYTALADPALLDAWGQEEHIIGYMLKGSDNYLLNFALGAAQREKSKKEEHAVMFAAMAYVAQREDSTMSQAYERIRNYAKHERISASKAAEQIVGIFNSLSEKMK
jgi:AmiR/NasT family two-component response regulator